MVRITLLHFVLIASLALCFFKGAAGQEKEGGAVPKGSVSIQTGSERKDAGKVNTERVSGKNDTDAVNKADEKQGGEDTVKKDTPVLKAERKKKEIKKKPPVKNEAPAADEAEDRKSKNDLLLIDHESMKYNRIPGITVKEERPEETIVKIPDDKIPGKTKGKNSKGGLFGSKTETIAKVGLLVFILIILILYKTRAKKSKRKVVRTVPKR
jgi:hypothetical protein